VHLSLARGADVRAELLPAAAAMQPSGSTAHMSCMKEACAD